MYGRLYRIKPNLISFELRWGLPEWEKAKFRGHVRLQKRKVFAPLCVKSKSQTSEVTDRLTGSHLTFNFLCFSTLPISFHHSDFEVVCLFLPLSLSPIILSFLCPRLLLASAHCPLYRFTLDFWSSFFLSVFKSGFFSQQLFFHQFTYQFNFHAPLSACGCSFHCAKGPERLHNSLSPKYDDMLVSPMHDWSSVVKWNHL